jgi:hypothetical protein
MVVMWNGFAAAGAISRQTRESGYRYKLKSRVYGSACRGKPKIKAAKFSRSILPPTQQGQFVFYMP